MIPNLLPALWWVWLLYLVLAAVYLGALASSGLSPTVTLAAAALALAIPGMTLALRPARALRLLYHRWRRTCDLRQPAELHTWPGQFETFRLGPKLSLRPRKGEVLADPPIALHDIQQVTLEQLGQHWHLSLSSQSDPGDPPSHKFQVESIHPACVPLLYWALWRLCQHNGWALRAPFGSQSAQALQSDIRDRLAQQHGWASKDLQGLRGDIPFLEEDSPALARYRFPMHDADERLQSALSSRAAAQHRHLSFLVGYSLLGLVTAPLAAPFLWLRARLTDRCEVELVIKDGQLHIGDSAEPLEDILYLSLLPVHPGAPVLLTRNRAVLLGGLTDYQERVLCGRHLLGRLLREMPQELPQRQGAARRLTRPGAAAAFLGRRWSWRPPEDDRPERAALLILLMLGLAGWSAYSWQPLTSAAQLFGNLPPLATLLQKPLWGAVFFAWAILWVLWRMWSPGDKSGPWLFKGVMMSMSMVAALGTLGLIALPYSHEALRGLPLNRVQAEGADLSQVDLKGLNLSVANFKGANLRGAELSNAFLRRSDLEGADLHGASLRSTDLRNANLRGADLRGADLYGAKLNFARVEGARLDDASLNRANLDHANLSGASLTGADLSNSFLLRADLKGARLTAATTSSANVWSALLDQRTICQNGRPKKLLDTETCMGLKTNPEEITCLDGAPQGPRSLRECLLEPRRPQGEP